MKLVRFVRISLVLVITFLALAASVSAQAPTRSGFFIGFGFGAGSFGVEDVDERETSLSGYFKIGGALSDRFLLGAESSGWTKEEDGATITSSALSAMAYFYPNAEGGLFFQGGLGISVLELGVEGFGSDRENGTALTLGLGYDIGFGGRFGLTPYATGVFGNYEAGNTSVFNFGLGFNWY